MHVSTFDNDQTLEDPIQDRLARLRAMERHPSGRAFSSRGSAAAEMARATRELIGSRTPEAAASAVARWCSRSLGAPVAVWLEEPDGGTVMAACATPHGAELILGDELMRISGTGPVSGAVLGAFAAACGRGTVETARSGPVTVAVASTPGESVGVRETAAATAELLADGLEQVREVERAERRNAELERSLAWTAHELRGPLLGIRAAVETALTLGSGESASRLLRGAQAELDAVAGLVGPLLRFAAGDEPLRLRRTDLGRIARQAATSVRRETGRANVQVHAGDRVEVTGAARYLRSAIANVLRNAVAYSPPDSIVTVEVGGSAEHATVRVADCGPGIAPDERSDVFDPFVRGSAGSGDRAGRGLGLFIAKRVIDAHGGRIWVESPGRGTIVHIELPIERREAA